MTDDNSPSPGQPHPVAGTTPHDPAAGSKSAAEVWNERYAERVWGGRVNAVLQTEVVGLRPGRVLDLGAGEGGDAIWLAGQGWQVTAVDVSAVALDRARADAEQAGVAERISFVVADLATDFPAGRYDLVSAHFLQSMIEFPRVQVLRRAAAAVGPGGVLLIVDHAAAPPWSKHQHDHFPTATQVFDSLELAAEDWEPPLLEVRERIGITPDGQSSPLLDNVIRVRRRA